MRENSRGFNRFRLVAIFATSCLLMACGGAGGGVVSASTSAISSGTTPVVSIVSNTDNFNMQLKLSSPLQADLSLMEQDTYKQISSLGGCDLSRSPYLPDVMEVVDRLNAILPTLGIIQPELTLLLAQSSPPRFAGSAALYLCNGIGFPAVTMHRSIFISNSFIGKLWLEAANFSEADLFRPSVAYLVYHEFAHAALGHSAIVAGVGGGGRFNLPQEVEADGLAYEILLATGYNPLGMLVAGSIN